MLTLATTDKSGRNRLFVCLLRSSYYYDNSQNNVQHLYLDAVDYHERHLEVTDNEIVLIWIMLLFQCAISEPKSR